MSKNYPSHRKLRQLTIILCLIFTPFIAANDELLKKFRANPREKQLWQPLVESLISKERHEEAIKILQDILKIDALHPFSMGMYSYLLLNFELKPQQAIEQAKKTLNVYPENIHALHTLGWSFYLEKEYEKAYQTFQRLPQQNITLLELQYHWALSAWKAAQASEAWRHFQIAEEINPTSLPLKVSIGLFLEEMNKIQQAVFYYNQALVIAPDNEPIHAFLLEKVSALLPLYKADTPIQSAKPKRSQTHTINQISAAKTENLTRENPFLKPVNPHALQHNTPDDFLSQEEHHALGLKFLAAKIKKDAISEFNTVINLNRTNPNAVSAHSYLTDTYTLPDISESQRIEQLMNCAETYFRDSQIKFAIYIYQKILLLTEKHPIARKNLAYLYLESSRPLSALQILETLCIEHPDFQEAIILKGYALAKLRRFPEAAAALRSAVNLGKARNFSHDYSEELLQQIKRYDKPLDIKINTD